MPACSTAVSTVGCQLFIDKVTPGTADLEVKGHVSIGFSGSTTTEIDATAMCDDTKQYMLGLVDAGTVSIGMNSNFSDAGQNEMRSKSGTDTIKTFKLELANGDVINFVGKIRQSKVDLGLDSKVSGTLDIRLTERATVIPNGGTGGNL